ncbi:MAG: atzA 1, partial [Rhodoferax sp.]|nr:atzA 1 [Rhodoferax sp.]
NALARHGVVMGLGLDEAGINDGRDMLQEMRLALRMHRVPGFSEADVPTCAQVLRMATEHGAATTPFKGQIGRLAPGMFFDAVAIDLHAATWPFQDDLVSPLDALLQRAKKEHVDTVYIGGTAVYAGGRFKHLDRNAVLTEIAGQLARPRSAAEESRKWLASAVMPHVKAFYADYLPA